MYQEWFMVKLLGSGKTELTKHFLPSEDCIYESFSHYRKQAYAGELCNGRVVELINSYTLVRCSLVYHQHWAVRQLGI
jgi:hypothetical protein